MSHQGTRNTLSARAAQWLDGNSGWAIAGAVLLTVLFAVATTVMPDRGDANQNPSSRVLDIRERVNDVFASPVHVVTVLVEARDGDMLTPDALSELLLNEIRLRSADAGGELAPDDLPQQSYLFEYFDQDLGGSINGVVSIANAVDQVLRNSPDLATTLPEATTEQVKVAVHRVLSSPSGEFFRETLSAGVTSETRVGNGREITWWTSPALVLNVFADNQALGGGTQTIAVGAGETVVDKERFNRNVQEVIRGDEETYRAWGVAIDLNLESDEEGQEAGLYITLTAIAAIGLAGIALRSYWSVALIGFGLGALIIWLKGISALVGLKGGLVADLIVPIAMISLGVDFAIHAIRRYQEEKSLGLPARRALVVGMSGVLGALTLALFTDSVAFLSNVPSGIESVTHFGLAAAAAVLSAFIVLGVVVPAALARVEAMGWNGRHAGGRIGRVVLALAGAGAAAGFGGAVIVMVAVDLLIGAAVLAGVAAGTLGLPLLIISLRRGSTTGTSADSAPLQSGMTTTIVQELVGLARYKYAVILLAVAVTAVSVWAATRLEATFDARDFLDPSSDFVTSLDKLDEHVGDQGGEPAQVYVRGDLSNLGALASLQAAIDSMEGNEYLSKSTDGDLNLLQPHALEIGRLIAGSEYARSRVSAETGVEISAPTSYGLPHTNEEMRAIFEYAIQHGVPAGPDNLIYTAARVQTALSLGPAGERSDEALLMVFLPGTREQETVAEAKEAIEADMLPLANSVSVAEFGVTGSPFLRQAQLDATTGSLQTSIPIAAVASLVLLTVLMRSVRYAMITTIPIGLVVAWLYAIMHVTGFALNFVTATIGAVSIGVGIDYSIHMTQRFREEMGRSPDRLSALRNAAGGAGVALGASAASSAVGFAIMGLAPMPLFSSYGVLTAVMIVLALAASLLVLPALLLLVTPERSDQTGTEPTAEVGV